MSAIFALSTRWNTFRHASGEALVEEIVSSTGFTHLELGYDLTRDLVPGVTRMVAEKVVSVDSVHNYCPVPMGAPQGHPELFTLAHPERRVRESAVRHTTQTVQFAAEIGARAVVCHAGNVQMRRYTSRLVELIVNGKQYSPKFERLRTKLMLKRDQKAPPYLEWLYAGVEALLPALEDARVCIAFENLPTWEALPTEMEVEALCRHFNSPWVRCWYDIGHGQIRQNLGLSAQKHWIGKLGPWLAGFHIHDVIPPARDHVMPPEGTVDFAGLAPVIPPNALKVFEPSPGTDADLVKNAAEVVRTAWFGAAADPSAPAVPPA